MSFAFENQNISTDEVLRQREERKREQEEYFSALETKLKIKPVVTGYASQLTEEDIEAIVKLCCENSDVIKNIEWPGRSGGHVLVDFENEKGLLLQDYLVSGSAIFKQVRDVVATQELYAAYMYKKFGEQYLTDLESHTMLAINMSNIKKLANEIDKMLSQDKNIGYIHSLTEEDVMQMIDKCKDMFVHPGEVEKITLPEINESFIKVEFKDSPAILFIQDFDITKSYVHMKDKNAFQLAFRSYMYEKFGDKYLEDCVRADKQIDRLEADIQAKETSLKNAEKSLREAQMKLATAQTAARMEMNKIKEHTKTQQQDKIPHVSELIDLNSMLENGFELKQPIDSIKNPTNFAAALSLTREIIDKQSIEIEDIEEQEQEQ